MNPHLVNVVLATAASQKPSALVGLAKLIVGICLVGLLLFIYFWIGLFLSIATNGLSGPLEFMALLVIATLVINAVRLGL